MISGRRPRNGRQEKKPRKPYTVEPYFSWHFLIDLAMLESRDG